MVSQVPRLRMFAGPNGSGKSTIKDKLPTSLIGYYINPDEIEKKIKTTSYINFTEFGINASSDEISSFFTGSEFLQQQADLKDKIKLLEFSDNKISFKYVPINSYFASVCASFIRNKLLIERKSFTFETVMSSDDKIEILKRAQSLGYRTYLYYVSTKDPLINERRVANRVEFGGHDVPKDKIYSRYERSMENLSKAIKFTNRAYIFDNSEEEDIWLAEITDSNIEFKAEDISQWFIHYVLNKFTTESY